MELGKYHLHLLKYLLFAFYRHKPTHIPFALQENDLKSIRIFFVNVMNVDMKHEAAAATNRSSGEIIPSCPSNSGGVATSTTGFP